ncbi:type VII secretion-associated protein [Mycobacterium parmense]|uniref:Type VII secretion-associated protein n=1 Tax=Mycobacterium parmense TaxID=185642 RepID=A0A7I7YXK5_9MYCO|nr:type VII secretion-associated protein [Mycobacterium parmense]
MADTEVIRALLGSLDDEFALVDERPVAVDSLWRSALAAVACAGCDGAVVVHPSWWSSARVHRVTAAMGAVTGDAVARPRSWLLLRASRAGCGTTAVVEIAERLVMVSGAEKIALPRRADPQLAGDEALAAIAGMEPAVVLIDAPGAVDGAATLARLIAGAARAAGRTVVEVDDVQLPRLARSSPPAASAAPRPPPGGRRRVRAVAGLGAAAAALVAGVPAVATVERHAAIPVTRAEISQTTFLVEGRVAVVVPAGWPTQRLTGGPGSARVQVTSPSDPEVALHVTQSPVSGETPGDSAQRLRRAIDAEPAGVFVDFNPTGVSAGRSGVTYREVRTGHHVRWTVLLDGPVRISIGCQSRPGGEDAIRAVCEQAVRSAHAI